MPSPARLRPLLAISCVAALVFVPLLHGGDLQTDAMYYAFIPKRVAATGDWLNFYQDWAGQNPYFNKPPLHFWLIAAAYRAVGAAPRSARSATAAC